MAKQPTDLDKAKDPEFVLALQHYLEKRNWRPADLSKATNHQVGKSSIGEWLSGNTTPRAEPLMRMLEGFGVLRWVFFKTGHDLNKLRLLEKQEEERRGKLLNGDLTWLEEAAEDLDPEELDRLVVALEVAARRRRDEGNGGSNAA